MQLDEKATYELTKIGTKNTDSRHYAEGDKAQGKCYIHNNSVVINSATGPVRTSEIVKFEDNGKCIILETKNSIYTLEKV